MDRRNKPRLDVELTCYVSPARVLARTTKAFTRNVSRTGMLMRWASVTPAPPVGKKLTVDIELPENSSFGTRLMQCHATVVRVENGENGDCSLALEIHGMKFIEPPSQQGGLSLLDLSVMPVPTSRQM